MKKVTFKDALEISRLLVATIHEVEYDKTSHKNLKSLNFLISHEGQSVKEMKEIILKKFPEMSKAILDVKSSKILKQLAKEELIEKAHDKDDKRCVLIKVTPKGKKYLKEFEALASKKWEEVNNG